MKKALILLLSLFFGTSLIFAQDSGSRFASVNELIQYNKQQQENEFQIFLRMLESGQIENPGFNDAECISDVVNFDRGGYRFLVRDSDYASEVFVPLDVNSIIQVRNNLVQKMQSCLNGKFEASGSQGKFNSCTQNPFALCSMGRPGKRNPLRGCWDALCP